MLLLVYTFVFNFVHAARKEVVDPYPLFMFFGLLPWTWFATSLTESSGVLISGGNLIKKVPFPPEFLPIVTVIANMVHFLSGLPILAVFLIWYHRAAADVRRARRGFQSSVLVQLIVTLGFALIVSALTVHFRDLRGHPQQSAHGVVLRDAHHLSVGQLRRSASRQEKRSLHLNVNPFMHLAVSYQEILFFQNEVGHEQEFGHLELAAGCWVLFPSCSSSSAIGCSIGCGIRLRKRCDT